MSGKKLSYKGTGVDIDAANEAKRKMAEILATNNARVLNKVGAFASLFDAAFPEYKHPVLVLKTEEPGSKQKLALEHGSIETICYDLVNHLVNDAIVMGAKPLSVQDCIVCGKLEKEVVLNIVSALSAACKENGAVLTGGETSEQPDVVPAGTYILTASIVGVVEKENITDGSKIREGDVVLALASSGVHTNGFSLIRKMLDANPKIADEMIEGKTFIETILTPHRAYYNCLKDLFAREGLVGLAHITGGGIKENLNRILPDSLGAEIDLSKLKVLPIFGVLKKYGNLEDADMLRTFNMGVGIAAVVRKDFTDEVIEHMKKSGVDAYEIGVIKKGNKDVIFTGQLRWS
ncbi:phosphoribosylformylglycinamidine cyclo-ligase [Candidatus Kaiserbacteria bacterium]|nr:phosphoribosylformylglycinamidine cyclo-ligase [Candidatus Kaiserbacteria bacterium]